MTKIFIINGLGGCGKSTFSKLKLGIILLSLTIGLPLVATAFTRDSILDIAPYRTYSNIPKPKKYKDLSNPQDYKKSSDNLKYFIVHGDSVSCFKIFI